MCGDDKSEVQLHSIKSCFIEYARYVNDMKYTKKAYGYSSWYNKVKYIDAFETFIKHFLKKKRLHSKISMSAFSTNTLSTNTKSVKTKRQKPLINPWCLYMKQ